MQPTTPKPPSNDSIDDLLNLPAQNDNLDIPIGKSLPEDGMQLIEAEIDDEMKLQLKNANDEKITLKEKSKPNHPLRIALGLTIGVLCTPLIISGIALGGTLGLTIGILKKGFMWDYSYGKEDKESKAVAHRIYFLTKNENNEWEYKHEKVIAFEGKSISKERNYYAELGFATFALGFFVAAVSIDKLLEERRKRDEDKLKLTST